MLLTDLLSIEQHSSNNRWAVEFKGAPFGRDVSSGPSGPEDSAGFEIVPATLNQLAVLADRGKPTVDGMDAIAELQGRTCCVSACPVSLHCPSPVSLKRKYRVWPCFEELGADQHWQLFFAPETFRNIRYHLATCALSAKCYFCAVKPGPSGG